MRRLTLVGLICLTLLLAACVQTDSWVQFTKKGGLQGSSASATVTKGGRVTVVKQGVTGSFELDAQQKAELEALLGAKSTVPTPTNPNARDVITYTLVVDGRQTQWDDSTESPDLGALRAFFESVAGI